MTAVYYDSSTMTANAMATGESTIETPWIACMPSRKHPARMSAAWHSYYPGMSPILKLSLRKGGKPPLRRSKRSKPWS